jgi:hypothetical protein
VLEVALPGEFDPPDVLALTAVLTTLPELLTTLRVFVPKRRFRAAFAKTLVPVAAVSPSAGPPPEVDVLLLEPATPLLEVRPPPLLPELLLLREPALLAPAAPLPNPSRLMVLSLWGAHQGSPNDLKSGRERNKLRLHNLKL